MASLDELKAGVCRSLPEVFEIQDEVLRGNLMEDGLGGECAPHRLVGIGIVTDRVPRA